MQSLQQRCKEGSFQGEIILVPNINQFIYISRFCGETTCKKCLRTYTIPKSVSLQRAKICVHCFKKFLIREQEEEKECYIRAAEASKDQIQTNMDMRKEKMDQIQDELNQINKEVRQFIIYPLQFSNNAQQFQEQVNRLEKHKRELKQQLHRKNKRQQELRQSYDLIGKELNEQYQQNKSLEEELQIVYYNCYFELKLIVNKNIKKKQKYQNIKTQLRSIRSAQPRQFQNKPPKDFPTNQQSSITINTSIDEKDQLSAPLLQNYKMLSDDTQPVYQNVNNGVKNKKMKKEKKKEMQNSEQKCCCKCAVF